MLKQQTNFCPCYIDRVNNLMPLEFLTPKCFGGFSKIERRKI